MKKRAFCIFLLNILMSTAASLIVPDYTLNGLQISMVMMTIGFCSLFYLHDQTRILWCKTNSQVFWGWSILWGSVASNLFERLYFGNVYDWIPLGIGMCNTADVGIVVGLVLILKGGLR